MTNFLYLCAFSVLFALTCSKSIESGSDDGFQIPEKAANVSTMRYFLYTKENSIDYQELFLDDKNTLEKSNYDASRPLKFFAHGFNSWPGNYLVHEFVNETNFNFIVLDWHDFAAGPDYFEAFNNMQLASEHVAKFFKFLVDNGKTRWEQIHIVGHSLGGQLVGQIGWRVQQLGGMLARITALDPALPLFDMAALENRTGPEDATFVDVIHTAANGLLAYSDEMGHIDWYPNGGRYQPGCGIDVSGGCSHGRASDMFAESITSNTFYGRKCDSYENFQSGACDVNKAEDERMGYHTPTTARGKYYLYSNSKRPYSKGPLP